MSRSSKWKSSALVGSVSWFLASSVCAQAVAWAHPDGTMHWYEAVVAPRGISWQQASRAAATAGGYLATVTSPAEAAHVFSVANRLDLWFWDDTSRLWTGPWIGGVQLPASAEPGGGWRWSEGGDVRLDNWASGQPDDEAAADRMHLAGTRSAPAQTWGDAPASCLLHGYVVEYSGALARKTVGLLTDAGAASGYTLLSPLRSTDSFLVDSRGRIVHSWTSRHRPGVASYLLENGNLLRAGAKPGKFAAGAGGIVEEFDWEGKVVWQFEHFGPSYTAHHDIERLPNGNTLLLVWETKTRTQAIAAGRNPSRLADELWPEAIVEVDRAGRIVWTWRAWDHLIQDFDPQLADYGDVGLHPERIDINYTTDPGADWLHANSLAYNATLDQIMISVRHFNEIWVIDHSTTTEEAAGHTGGRSGRGGDLLYRWGNPQAYRVGTEPDQRLFQQHDAHWIPAGHPGAGNILIFNNGGDRPGGDASTVDELVPPRVDQAGNYAMTGRVWGPAGASWSYPRTPSKRFFSSFVSGAQRLANGNTLVCAGAHGRSLEVTRDGVVVWEYVNPVRQATLEQAAWQGDQTAGNVVFRSPRYPVSYPGLKGKQLTPRGPVERYKRGLLVEGSRTRLLARPGDAAQLSLIATGHPGRTYLLGTSASAGLLPIDYRFLRQGLDPLLLSSMFGEFPTVFRGYVGRLDAEGRATASLVLPRLPALLGVDFHTSFLVLDPGAMSSVAATSNAVVVRIER